MDADGAELVVKWYLELEKRLCSVLDNVYKDSPSSSVFFPQLTNVIVDAGSLVDTIFRSEFDLTKGQSKKPKTREKLNIDDFAPYYEQKLQLSGLKSLVYQYPLSYINPYFGWVDSAGKRVTPEWWDNYNAIKHDRIQSSHLSTCGTAISTLGALFQVMARLDIFFDSLLRHDLVDLNGISIDGPLSHLLEAIETEKILHTLLFETQLFGVAFGCFKFPDKIELLNPAHFGGKKMWKYAGRHR